MSELQPAHFTQEACHTAQGDRQVFSSLVCSEGVRAPEAGNLRVSASPSPLTVTVAAGGAFVQGDTVSGQGMYHVYNTAAKNLAVQSADPTDTRRDRVVARVYDAQYSGTDNVWALEVITGSPSPAPVPPAEPDNAITLALLTITPGSSVIPANNVADSRAAYQLCESSVAPPARLSSSVPAASGFTSSATVTRVGDTVIMYGSFTRANWTSGGFVPAGTLPVGYRPDLGFITPLLYIFSGTVPFQVQVGTDGVVSLRRTVESTNAMVFGTLVWFAAP